MATKKEGNKPIGKYRCGKACVTIWANQSKKENSQPFNVFKLEKNFVKNGKWQSTNTFTRSEVQDLQLAISQALFAMFVKAE